MNRIERAQRDARILEMFIAGATYRQIADRLSTADAKISHAQVDRVVKREMNNAAKRRDVLADKAFDMFVERTEAIFKAHYPKALRGDYRSSVICDRLLTRQARLYGIDGTGGGSRRSGPTDPDNDPVGDDADEDEGDVSDLDRFRANRRRA